MLKRKIINDLIKWKKNKDKLCLIVDGARQVGKTFIIEKFAKENYKNYIYINFVKNPDYMNIFANDLDYETIIKNMSIMIPNIDVTAKDTIIFLDEIQVCPRAITALKFLSIEHKVDVIASGSLLGIRYKSKKGEIVSYPVGYVEHLSMYSLDFEEFLWANGITEDMIKDIHDKYFLTKKQVPIAIHNKMMSLFKEYIVIGGMPKVVDYFITNHDFNGAFKIQKNIIEEYKNDIVLYADDEEKSKIRDVFDSIPYQLAKENKKFQYKLVEKKGTADKFNYAIQWLIDADIVVRCNNLDIPELPLQGNAKNDAFKIYMCDTGLLMAMMEEGSQLEIIKGNLGIYKGAIYENIIADAFNKQGRKVYYFEKDSKLEIDFIIRYENKVTAVEVKSADNTKSKSLKSLIDNYNVTNCIRLSSKNIGTSNNTVFYPLYMVIFLN